MNDVTKGQCLTCEHCGLRDDGYERQLVCKKTLRGRTITWTMHVASKNDRGELVPWTTAELDARLKDSMKNRIPPKWCVFRK